LYPSSTELDFIVCFRYVDAAKGSGITSYAWGLTDTGLLISTGVIHA